MRSPPGVSKLPYSSLPPENNIYIVSQDKLVPFTMAGLNKNLQVLLLLAVREGGEMEGTKQAAGEHSQTNINC